METFALTLAALMTVGSVVFVAQPFLRRSQQRHEREPREPVSPRLTLLERRDRALAALKELEFDHRTGKISDVDYLSLLAPLRREAADALHSLAGRGGRAARSREAGTHRRKQPARAAAGEPR